MPFSRNQDNILLLSQTYSRFNSLFPIRNRDIFSFSCTIQTRFHILQNITNLFASWVVACKNNLVAQVASRLCHNRSLCLVSVATATYYRNNLFVSFSQLLDGAQHILQSIGRVGVIDNPNDLLATNDVIKPAFCTCQHT